MGDSELDYKGKLNKLRENLYKKLQEVRNQFSQIEKIKVEAIKKIDEFKSSTASELQKIEESIGKSKDLVPDSKEKLYSEIKTLKNEIEEKYNEIRKKITETTTPT